MPPTVDGTLQAVVCPDHRAPQAGIENSPVRAILIVYIGYVTPSDAIAYPESSAILVAWKAWTQSGR